MKKSIITCTAFFILLSGQAIANNEYYAELERYDTKGVTFISAQHYSAADPESLTENNYYSVKNFPGAPDPKTAIKLPDSDLDPVTRSILITEAIEPPLPHTRYLVAYSMDISPEFPEIEQHYVEVTRFNVGSEVRNDLLEYVSEDHLAGLEEFGIGPHISWRFVMSPRMGMEADITHASRREVSNTEASTTDCLGEPCLSLTNPNGPDAGWETISPVHVEAPFFVQQTNAGITHPARAAQEVWANITAHGMDPLPYSETQPHFIFVVSSNIGGQDGVSTILAKQLMVMDHAIAEVWTRREEVSGMEARFAELMVPR